MTTINLQSYFPDNVINTYNKSDGISSSRYSLQRSLPGAPTGIDSLYYGYMALPSKPGVPYMWRKEYWRNGAWCTDTYATLFMGTDLSVTECGDWRSGTPCTPDRVLGYRETNTSTNSGIVWAGVGGLSTTPIIKKVDVWGQNTIGGSIVNSNWKAFSRTGLIEVFSTYTPPYGRDSGGVWGAGLSKTYTDVVHIVMYHGTKGPTPFTQVRCTPPLKTCGVPYASFEDYNSYAIELYLAAGIGIIQENTPFVEDASTWGGAFPNCSGGIFATPTDSWTTYIDQM